MSLNLTAAIYDRLSPDPVLAALVAVYENGPAVFTTDPPPPDASLPYIVSAGEVTQRAADTKNSRGREVFRDVRCYAPADGSAVTVEAMAEQVRELLHRHRLAVDGFETWIAEASGPIAADEQDAYGRIVTIRLRLEESLEGS